MVSWTEPIRKRKPNGLKERSHHSTSRRGTAFIERKDLADVFVHDDAVTDGEAKNLKAGTRVEDQMDEGLKGPRAASVRLL
ncbi:MAG: hypothetical protein GF341_12030 [candidate division Zixibacteria bacterium]|nr:hypothetical protein [candidate division Zixibacteria bacterium]